MKKLEYTSLEDQINKLKEQGLIINSVESAKSALKLYGYSNLIRGYRDPYMVYVDGKRQYRNGVTFEQIVSLYLIDKNLRNAVMASMLDLEEHLRVMAAEVIGTSFGIDQNDYLRFKNYRDHHKKQHRFTLSGILERMNDAIKTDKDPIHYYYSKYGIVPPWILFKSIYFSTLVNFIHCFKPKQAQALFALVYPGLDSSAPEGKILMMDTLFLSLEYRNLAAHGGQIYSHICKYELNPLGKYSTQVLESPGFRQLLMLLELLGYKNPYDLLNNTLNGEINRHCTLFPDDVTYLSRLFNINIVRHDYVYTSANGKIYHSDPHCSGMHNAITVDYADVAKTGLRPCKRCVHKQ